MSGFGQTAQGRGIHEVAGQLGKGPGGHAAAGNVLVLQPLEQPGTGDDGQVPPGLRQTADGPEAGAAQRAVIAEVVVPAQVDDIGDEHPVELLGRAGTGGQHFAEGFGDAPADVAGLLVHVPHEAAHDVVHVFGAALFQTGHHLPQGQGGLVAHERFQQQEGEERPHGGLAHGAQFGQMVTPVGRGKQIFQLLFDGTHTGHGAAPCVTGYRRKSPRKAR